MKTTLTKLIFIASVLCFGFGFNTLADTWKVVRVSNHKLQFEWKLESMKKDVALGKVPLAEVEEDIKFYDEANEFAMVLLKKIEYVIEQNRLKDNPDTSKEMKVVSYHEVK